MSAPLSDRQFEAELRAMLQRRARDVQPEPPPWRELAQRNGAVVISLRTGTPVDPSADRERRRPGRPWFRGAVAAAVALILAMVGALVVQRSGSGGGDTADGPEPIDVPSAGQTDFDATRATPLFPIITDDASDALPQDEWLSDPTATAEKYLRDVGLATGEERLVIDEAIRQTSTIDDGGDGENLPVQIAKVAWSLRAEGLDSPALSEGYVFLRNPELGARDTWLVVGVFTFDLQVAGIRRDGDELSFTVDRTTEPVTETFESQPAVVRVDGAVVAEVGYLEARPITVVSPAGRVAVIQVQHMIGSVPWSITSTAVPAIPGGSLELPGAVPPTVTVPPATTVPGLGLPTEPTVTPDDPTAAGAAGEVVVSGR